MDMNTEQLRSFREQVVAQHASELVTIDNFITLLEGRTPGAARSTVAAAPAMAHKNGNGHWSGARVVKPGRRGVTKLAGPGEGPRLKGMLAELLAKLPEKFTADDVMALGVKKFPAMESKFNSA